MNSLTTRPQVKKVYGTSKWRNQAFNDAFATQSKYDFRHIPSAFWGTPADAAFRRSVAIGDAQGKAKKDNEYKTAAQKAFEKAAQKQKTVNSPTDMQTVNTKPEYQLLGLMKQTTSNPNNKYLRNMSSMPAPQLQAKISDNKTQAEKALRAAQAKQYATEQSHLRASAHRASQLPQNEAIAALQAATDNTYARTKAEAFLKMARATGAHAQA